MLGVKEYNSTIQSDGKIICINSSDNVMIRITGINDLKHNNQIQDCSIIKSEEDDIIDVVIKPNLKSLEEQRLEKRGKENRKLMNYA